MLGGNLNWIFQIFLYHTTNQCISYIIYSGIGHAAANGVVNAISGDGEEDGVLYDEHDGVYDNNQLNQNEHPCMKYWDAFQQCMNMNGDDISQCQNMYNVFNRCQRNPDGMLF